MDDVLVDAFNLPGLDTHQLEGKLNAKPISNIGFYFLLVLIFLVFSAFVVKAFKLQVVYGDKYYAISQENTLSKETIFAKRGIIKDRNGIKLAYNSDSKIKKQIEDADKDIEIYTRHYTDLKGLAHVLGYVKYPAYDSKGKLWRDNYEGVGGVEEYFNDLLNGENGALLIEKDVSGKVVSSVRIKKAKDGKDLTLSIDAKLSDALYKALEKYLNESQFQGAASVILDVRTGEVLALVSVPEFDLNKFVSGDKKYIESALQDSRKPLLNRAALGLYTPGSIVKPFVALAALNEKIIDPNKKILSTGALKIENPYYPGTYNIFKDWKAHGYINMKEAIAHSSNVYFYEVGGGYEEQEGLGIKRLLKYAKLFGFGEKTGVELPSEESGVVPSPKWKMERFGEKWLLGNTYHTAIGQYGFLVTALQAARYMAAIANYGKLYTPTLIKENGSAYLDLGFDKKDINVIHDGMRMSVRIGTARPLNIAGIKIAAKTGTAQTGAHNEYKNSWVVGFWPYDDPKYAFATVLEKGPAKEHGSASHAMIAFFEFLKKEMPEYIK